MYKYSFFFLITFLVWNSTFSQSNYFNYPKIKKDTVIDSLFSDKIIDEYRYLEFSKQSNQVKKWIKEQNDIYDSIINIGKVKDSIYTNLKNLYNTATVRGGFPRCANQKIFYVNSYIKESNQVLYYRDSLNSSPIELFATNSIKNDTSNYGVEFFEPSYDGKYIAIGLLKKETGQIYLMVLDVEKKKLLKEIIERAEYSTPTWNTKNDGFYYTQLKEIRNSADENTMYEDVGIKFHKLNSNATEDIEVFSRLKNYNLPINAIDFNFIHIYPNSNFQLISSERGSNRYYRLLLKKEGLNDTNWKIILDFDLQITSFTMFKNVIYFISNNLNQNGTLMKINLNSSHYKPKLVYENRNEVLQELISTKTSVYLKSTKNSNSVLYEVKAKDHLNEIQLPYNGTLRFTPKFNVVLNYNHCNNLYFSMESWLNEFSVYMFDLTKKSEIYKTNLRQAGKYKNNDAFNVKLIEVNGHDNIKIPLTILYKKGIILDGKNPCIIQGYGAYGISLFPEFSFFKIGWLEMGGIIAIAHVRGGGEKGNDWYIGGLKATKENSWKDFISCSNYLIDSNYTSSQLLAARAYSAGGITIGRAIEESPNLYKGAILHSAELNSLRSESSKNTVATSEFGTIKNYNDYINIKKMDVYQNINYHSQYPALLFTAGLKDNIVEWWNSGKIVARLQSHYPKHLTFIKLYSGGHTTNSFDEYSEDYSFLYYIFKSNRLKIRINEEYIEN